jgi:hypothetical protein
MSIHGPTVKELRTTLGQKLPQSMGSIQRSHDAARDTDNPGQEQDLGDASRHDLPWVGGSNAQPPLIPAGTIWRLLSPGEIGVPRSLIGVDIRIPPTRQGLNCIRPQAEKDGII